MLRIQVTSGGCHGFQYLMSLTSSRPESSSAAAPSPPSISSPPSSTSKLLVDSPLTASPTPTEQEEQQQRQEDDQDQEDTIFQATDGTEAKVIMDEPSLELLKGSKVDFTTELIGSQFRIVDNPKARSSCGCGTSFDVV